MDNNLPKNQPSTLPPAPQVIPPKKSNPFLYFLLGILFTLLFGGGIAILFKDKLNISQPVPSPVPAATVIPASGLTAEWKTYENSDFSFKYPSSWQINNKGKPIRISSTDPEITLRLVAKGLMWEECVRLDESYTANGLLVRKFSQATTGDMCSSGATNPKYYPKDKVWFISKEGREKDFGPGLTFSYDSTQAVEAEQIFDQILSTFKFTQ